MDLVRFYRVSLLVNGVAAAVPMLLYAWLRGADDAFSSWLAASLVTLIAGYFLTRHGVPKFWLDLEKPNTTVGQGGVERRMVQAVFILPVLLAAIASAAVAAYEGALSRVGWIVVATAWGVGKDLEGLTRLSSKEKE